MSAFEFWIEGKPLPFARHQSKIKGVTRSGKITLHHYEGNESTRAWKRLVGIMAKQRYRRDPHPHPTEIIMMFYMPRTLRVQKVAGDGECLHPRRPDVDNLTKAILDGLNNVVIQDDGQVWRIVAEKRYHARGRTPGVLVTVKWDEHPKWEML